jgi:hypothetical protein
MMDYVRIAIRIVNGFIAGLLTAGIITPEQATALTDGVTASNDASQALFLAVSAVIGVGTEIWYARVRGTAAEK